MGARYDGLACGRITPFEEKKFFDVLAAAGKTHSASARGELPTGTDP